MTSRGRWQYQISSKPIAPIANPTQTDSFFQPFSDPIQLSIKTISVALIASQVVSMVPPTSGGNAWHSTAVTVPQHSDSLPSSVTSFQYQAKTQPVTTTVGTVFVSDWFEPLSEPVRTPPRAVWFQSDTYTEHTTAAPGVSWFAPLSEPVRTKPIDVWFQDWTKGMQPVVSFSYYQPLSEPVRTPPRDVWFQPDTLTRTQSDVTGIQYTPLSEPVRTAARSAWYQDETTLSPFPIPNTQALPPLTWFSPLADPVRVPLRTAWYQDLTLDPIPIPNSTAIPMATLSGDAQFSQSQLQYQASAFVPVTTTAATVSIGWFGPLSDPVRVALRDAWYQPDTLVQIVQQDTLGSWYEPLTEPVRTVQRDVWFQPDTKSLNPVVSFSYYEPLSEPVRAPLRDAWYQPDTLTRTATDVTGIKYTPLSEPVRTALRTAWYQDEALTQIVQQDTLASWFVPLSDPVRVQLRDAWYQDETFSPFPLPNSTVTPDSWLPHFDDFARTGQRVSWNQDLAYVAGAVVPTTLTTLQSWEPWSEPVRLPANISIYPPWAYVDTVDIVVDTGKVWPRYWMQYDPNHSINRDAPHDLVWADEDDIITVLLLS